MNNRRFYSAVGLMTLVLLTGFSLYVQAAPTSTIVQNLFITGIKPSSTSALVIGSTGLVATGGTSGSVTTSSPVTVNNFPYWTTAGGALSGTSTLSRLGQQLTVQPSVDATGTVLIKDTSGAVGFQFDETTSGSVLDVEALGSPALVVASSGFIGAGTGFPSSTLHVVGGFMVQPSLSIMSLFVSSSTANVGIGTSSPAMLFSVATSSPILTAGRTGLVGVGTAQPSSTLHVLGSVTLGASVNSAFCFSGYPSGTSTLYWWVVSTSTTVTGLGYQPYVTSTKPTGC